MASNEGLTTYHHAFSSHLFSFCKENGYQSIPILRLMFHCSFYNTFSHGEMRLMFYVWEPAGLRMPNTPCYEAGFSRMYL